MAAPHAAWHRRGLIVVTLGAMAVSITGQVAAIETQLGFFLAVVFALVNDAGAIIALNASMRAEKRSPVRRWAWVAIVVAAGSGALLNVLHASTPPGTKPPLPWEYALLVGIEPVVLVLILSHLISLVIEQQRVEATHREDRETPTASSGPGREIPAPAPRAHTARSAVEPTARTARSAADVVVTTGAPDREIPAPAASSGRVAAPAATTPLPPRLHLAPAPQADRPGWMTAQLLDAVIATAREAGAPAKQYGEGRLIRDHSPLPDGSTITSHKAKAILTYIREHDLLKAAS